MLVVAAVDLLAARRAFFLSMYIILTNSVVVTLPMIAVDRRGSGDGPPVYNNPNYNYINKMRILSGQN